jgi:hypothetical protein
MVPLSTKATHVDTAEYARAGSVEREGSIQTDDVVAGSVHEVGAVLSLQTDDAEGSIPEEVREGSTQFDASIEMDDATDLSASEVALTNTRMGQLSRLSGTPLTDSYA